MWYTLVYEYGKSKEKEESLAQNEGSSGRVPCNNY
jgi:hypothetical protein